MDKLNEMLYGEDGGLVTVLSLDVPARRNEVAESIADDFLTETQNFLESVDKERLNKLEELIINLVADIVNRPEEFIPEFLEELTEMVMEQIREQAKN